MITDANRRTIQYLLKETLRSHTAIRNWFNWCDGLHAAKLAAKLFEDDADYNSEEWIARSVAVERAYMATHKKPSMPSKDRKHQMYARIYRAADLAGVEAPAGSINTMEDVFKTMAAVTAMLAVS